MVIMILALKQIFEAKYIASLRKESAGLKRENELRPFPE